MQLQIDNLGKVSVTIEQGYWNKDKDYDKLTIVEKEGIFGTFISRKPVPAGTVLTNREYWIPFSSLKENIILDYNSFKDTYDNTIKEHTASLKDIIIRLNELEENKELIEELINTANNAINESNSSLKEIKEIKTNIESIANSFPNDVVIDVKAVNNNNSDLSITHNNLKTKTVDTVFQEIPRLTELYNKIGKPNGLATLDSSGKLPMLKHKVLSDVNQLGVIGQNPKEYEVGNAGKLNIKRITKIEYSELVNLRNNGQLIPGMWYELLDYIPTTTQDNTDVTDHVFDILLLATSNNTLSEEAKAVRHEGDNYYPDYVQFNAWKIWYCLDNDTSRFFWADEENGKGVIYRMIDEFGNDCPYDFKNILFEFNGRYVFTFNSYYDETIDTSIYEYKDAAKNNKITPLIKTIEVDYKSFETQLLNNIVLIDHLDSNIGAEEYSPINIKNNLFINCYDSVISRPANNVIINSSINLASECTNNNIQNCIFDIAHDSAIYPEFTDGIHLVGNTIQNSVIHESAKDTVEEFYDMIIDSTVINTDIYDETTNLIKINDSYINGFKYDDDDTNYCHININDSNVFDLKIQSNAEDVTIFESFISGTVIMHNFDNDETRKYIEIYHSNITDSIDMDIVSVVSSTIEHTMNFTCIKPIDKSSIKQVTNFDIPNNELLHTELKHIRNINSESLNSNDITYATLYIDRHGDLIIDKR